MKTTGGVGEICGNGGGVGEGVGSGRVGVGVGGGGLCDLLGSLRFWLSEKVMRAERRRES